MAWGLVAFWDLVLSAAVHPYDVFPCFQAPQSGSPLVSAQRAKAAAGARVGAAVPGPCPGAGNLPTVEGGSPAVRATRLQASSVQQGRCGHLSPPWLRSGSGGHLSGGSAGFWECRELSPSPGPLFPQNNTFFF